MRYVVASINARTGQCAVNVVDVIDEEYAASHHGLDNADVYVFAADAGRMFRKTIEPTLREVHSADRAPAAPEQP